MNRRHIIRLFKEYGHLPILYNFYNTNKEYSSFIEYFSEWELGGSYHALYEDNRTVLKISILFLFLSKKKKLEKFLFEFSQSNYAQSFYKNKINKLGKVILLKSLIFEAFAWYYTDDGFTFWDSLNDEYREFDIISNDK